MSWALAFPVLAEPLDLGAELAEARRIGHQEGWQQAQVRLDRLAPYLDRATARELAEFHLLEARHLALAGQSEAALERVAVMLKGELEPDLRLRSLEFSANIGVLLRQYERAFEYLGEALTIALPPDQAALRMGTLNIASYMLGRVGEYERGIEHGERAVVLALSGGQDLDVCIALQRLAPVYKWAGRLDEAERAYRDGLAYCEAIGNDLFVGVLAHGLADLLRSQQRLQEAEALARRAIELLVASAYPLGEFEARVVLAEVLAADQRLPGAFEQALVELGEFFRAQELWDQYARLLELRVQMAEHDGRYAQALDLLREYISAREAFLGRDRAMRLAFLQVEFNARFQQQEIELLRETMRVAQLESRAASQQRRLRGLLLLLVALSFVALIALSVRLSRSRRRFRELSRQDQLSGLANHSWFFEHAAVMIKRHQSRREFSQLVLVAADIDHFKRINDEFGHRVGDGVLCGTARLFREAFPEQALVGRIGGEEFAALVPVDRLEEVLGWIDAIRRPAPSKLRADDPRVTISFGVSCYCDGDDIESLRERADAALYQAKQQGRDRCIVDPGCAGAA
ncbi:MAG: diguanylate cyclase domain-containing protein [Wenzhouxiangella sp.]